MFVHINPEPASAQVRLGHEFAHEDPLLPDWQLHEWLTQIQMLHAPACRPIDLSSHHVTFVEHH